MTLLLSCPAPAAEDTEFVHHAAHARALVAAPDAGASPERQRGALESLVSRASASIPAFSRRHPACAGYLDAALTLQDRSLQRSLQEIERDFHHDALLRAVSDAAARPLCHQMQDLLVHPITALRRLEAPAPDRDRFRHGIVEVIAHAQALAMLMAQP